MAVGPIALGAGAVVGKHIGHCLAATVALKIACNSACSSVNGTRTTGLVEGADI
ncbi:hypothetical protein PspTeo4_10232 [Pseudomonas sp. Teo4]|nr:hypothetical protein [Pseudomonas sp. Teo4]